MVAVHRDTMSGWGRNDDTNDKVLTADVERAAERRRDLRVELDHELLLLCKLFVATLDLLRDPLPQVFTNNGVNHVDDPLSRKLGDVASVGHVVLDLLHPQAEVKDALDRESQVAGDVQVLRRLGLDNYRDVKDMEMHLLFLCPLTMSLRK